MEPGLGSVRHRQVLSSAESQHTSRLWARSAAAREWPRAATRRFLPPRALTAPRRYRRWSSAIGLVLGLCQPSRRWGQPCRAQTELSQDIKLAHPSESS